MLFFGKSKTLYGGGESGGAAVGQGETASAPAKVPLQKDLENISVDGSVPPTSVCPRRERWQRTGQWATLSFPQVGN